MPVTPEDRPLRVLITGGAGYIGSHTARLLDERGHHVVILDTLERGYAAAVTGLRLIVGDVADRTLVERLLRDESIEAVVHFAARKSVEESLADPGGYFRANVCASIQLLEAMATTGVARLVYSSTCAVYGTPDRLPVDEDCAPRPENPYGESKLLVERMLPWFERAHGLRSVTLRYFNAAGAADDGGNGEDWSAAHNLIPIAMKVALGRIDRLVIHGTDYPTLDGTAVRDYIHVLDLAEAHLGALGHLAGGGPSRTYDVGTGRGASVREVVELVRSITGIHFAVEGGPRRPGDPPSVWADGRRARLDLDWAPHRGLDEIIRSAWLWHSTHPDGHGHAETHEKKTA